MKTMTKLLTLGSLLGATALLAAQDGPPPGRDGQGGQGGPGGRRPIPPLVAALDANQDREIDAAEIANASAALKKLDKNGDGKLAQDGFMGQRPGGPGGQGGRPPLPPLVAALDAGKDGGIDAGELANASVALKQLDKNGDGKLTQDEFMGPRPGGPGGQGGQGGPGNRPRRPSAE